MKVLICAEDVIQVAGIRDAIGEIIEKTFATNVIPLDYVGTYAVQTKKGTREEIRIYILPTEELTEFPQRLERLARRLADKLSLDKSQVTCASFFPG